MLKLKFPIKNFSRNNHRNFIRKCHKKDDIPYIEKYKDSAFAESTLRNLNDIFNKKSLIHNDELLDTIYNKFNKYRKITLKDYKSEIYLIIYKFDHSFKFFADHNYKNITNRLNQLHVSYELLNIINNLELSDNDIYINLNISSYTKDERNSEWQ